LKGHLIVFTVSVFDINIIKISKGTAIKEFEYI
jgi:hypothetical protein